MGDGPHRLPTQVEPRWSKGRVALAVVVLLFSAFALLSYFRNGGVLLFVGTDTDLRIWNGVLEVRHVYEEDTPVAQGQWMNDPSFHSAKPPAPTFWEVTFSS